MDGHYYARIPGGCGSEEREMVDRFLDPAARNWAAFDSLLGYKLRDSVVNDGVDGSYTISRYSHRYSLSMEGISTVILGVKDRTELRGCVAAETMEPLDSGLMARIDEAVVH